mgnify:CR=1 FL=1
METLVEIVHGLKSFYDEINMNSVSKNVKIELELDINEVEIINTDENRFEGFFF